MTKRLGVFACALGAFALVLALAPGRAEARRHYGGNVGGEPGASTFGIGLILGAPTGLSMELRLSESSALDFAIGLNSFNDRDGGYFHFDYLAYLTDLAGGGGSVAVPFYLGVGAVFWDNNDRFNDNDNLNGGLRIPLGLAIAFRSAPVQFFGEIAFNLIFLDENDNNGYLELTGALGLRVYF